MAFPNTYNFTTGPTNVPDVGVLKYNGCTFSPLFETKVSGNAVKDNAKRTIKYIEYTIIVDGFVTLPQGANATTANISDTMATLYNLLNAQAGFLIYKGRALDIVCTGHDLAWGPVPETLEFQPLGAGRSAKVTWKVTVRIPPPELAAEGGLHANFGAGKGSLGIVQMNYETSLSYDEAGYSTISIKGTIEGQQTRLIGPKDRTVNDTVDRFRRQLEERILTGIDLGRFHITKRTFNISRDKRTMEWDIEAQEKPYMDLPPKCTIARGTYSVRPVKQGVGLAKWMCTLRATYTVAGGERRDHAEIAFFTLMFLRMQQTLIDADTNTPQKGKTSVLPILLSALTRVPQPPIKQGEAPKDPRLGGKEISNKPLIIDFTVEEGLYLDSRTITFSATWRFICRLSQIMVASGVWRRVEDGGRNQKKNIWAQSMILSQHGNIMGAKSWLENKLDPKLDLIIDLGSSEV